MTSQSPRIYIYKITFEEVLYYYYGVHKEKKFNEYYMGSPITHKWMWDFYTPKKQIFEIFDYNDDGWLQALEIEERLIRPFFNTDKWCLNENCGGKVSLNIKRKAGRESGHIGGRIAGKKFKEENLGIFAMSEKEKHERNIKGGKIIGKLLKEQKRGIFAIDAQQRSLNSQKGAKKVNAQKWQCTVTGYISNPGALSTYQKKRGIDVSKRRKIE